MTWDLEPGPTADGADIAGTTVYLWGFVVVFVVALTLGGWAWDRARQTTSDTLWDYFVMALLWPLFVSAVLYLILWTVLTRRNRRN